MTSPDKPGSTPGANPAQRPAAQPSGSRPAGTQPSGTPPETATPKTVPPAPKPAAPSTEQAAKPNTGAAATIVGGASAQTTTSADNPVGADADELPALIEQVVLDTPAVAGLDRGPFGAVQSYLPGRRVVGVSTAGPGEPVEISVRLYAGSSVPTATKQLRERVRAVAGDVPVDILVSDLVLPGEEEPVVPSTSH